MASTGFAVASHEPSVGGAAATAPAAPLAGLLQLQEFEDAVTRDRQARRHGHALLRELGELQRLLLGDDKLDDVLGRLATLTEASPEAADPALASTLAAIVLRARVELARRVR